MHSTEDSVAQSSGPTPRGGGGAAPEAIFTIDVEDWFHILDLPTTPPLARWNELPSRVEANFHRLLDTLDVHHARATCFFLGWVGERFPHLVREAARRGHEVASHGFAHRLVYELTPAEFREDARRARMVLEDIIGAPVQGYRSAGFSATNDTPWFFEEVVAAGYSYDSSVFPAVRNHGGVLGAPRSPYTMNTPKGMLTEFPISVADVAGRPVCFFGGGYLRIFPYWLVREMSRRVIREGRPVVFYVHPREIDPSHPRLEMNLKRRFKTYVNLGTMLPKVESILRDFRVTTFRDYLERAGNSIHGESHAS